MPWLDPVLQLLPTWTRSWIAFGLLFSGWLFGIFQTLRLARRKVALAAFLHFRSKNAEKGYRHGSLRMTSWVKGKIRPLKIVMLTPPGSAAFVQDGTAAVMYPSYGTESAIFSLPDREVADQPTQIQLALKPSWMSFLFKRVRILVIAETMDADQRRTFLYVRSNKITWDA